VSTRRFVADRDRRSPKGFGIFQVGLRTKVMNEASAICIPLVQRYRCPQGVAVT